MARKTTDIVALTLRAREDLRKRLEREAKRNDRSLNNEMVARLEGSFTQSERLADIFGSDRNVALFRSIAGAIEAAEAKAGKSWVEDAGTRDAVMYAAIATIKLHSLKTTPSQRNLARGLSEKPMLTEAEEIQQMAQLVKSVIEGENS